MDYSLAVPIAAIVGVLIPVVTLVMNIQRIKRKRKLTDTDRELLKKLLEVIIEMNPEDPIWILAEIIHMFKKKKRALKV